MYEKWKRRENEHANVWNTENFKKNERLRVAYVGDYVIDSISKQIQLINTFSTFKRRLLTEVPLVFFGASIIILLFFVFTKYTK